jgi:hypothetical protein
MSTPDDTGTPSEDGQPELEESDAPTAEMPTAETPPAEPASAAPATEAPQSPRKSVTIHAPRRGTVLIAAGVIAAFVVGAVAGQQFEDGRDDGPNCRRAAPWMDCGPAFFGRPMPPGFGQRGPDGFGDRNPFRDGNDPRRFNG